eukprot:scaffold785_cov95-Cylindrotheca_fusiformis.AAC.2
MIGTRGCKSLVDVALIEAAKEDSQRSQENKNCGISEHPVERIFVQWSTGSRSPPTKHTVHNHLLILAEGSNHQLRKGTG